MIRSRFLLIVSVLVIAVATLAGCHQSEQRASAAGLRVDLFPDTSYPGSTMTVAITDEAGKPITDLTVSLEGNMTHAGMVPVLSEAVWDGADGLEDGLYHVPFAFTMLGDWIISVNIERRQGDPLTEEIDLRVSSDGVTVVQN